MGEKVEFDVIGPRVRPRHPSLRAPRCAHRSAATIPAQRPVAVEAATEQPALCRSLHRQNGFEPDLYLKAPKLAALPAITWTTGPPAVPAQALAMAAGQLNPCATVVATAHHLLGQADLDVVDCVPTPAVHEEEVTYVADAAFGVRKWNRSAVSRAGARFPPIS